MERMTPARTGVWPHRAERGSGTDAMTEPDLRAIARAPLLVPYPLQRYGSDPGRHAVYDGVVLIAYGGYGPEFNVAVALDAIPPERLFALANDFFGTTGYAITVEAAPGKPPSTLEADLRARGWHLDEEEPALVLASLPAAPPPPPGLTILQVTTEATFADFLALSETARRWIPSLSAALDSAAALFVGYLGDEPVATSRLTCYGAVGEINGVVTVPAQRRRGFGAALTWAAIAEGTRRGCEAMTLTATPMGYPLYRRLGFAPVCTCRTYLPPGSASE